MRALSSTLTSSTSEQLNSRIGTTQFTTQERWLQLLRWETSFKEAAEWAEYRVLESDKTTSDFYLRSVTQFWRQKTTDPLCGKGQSQASQSSLRSVASSRTLKTTTRCSTWRALIAKRKFWKSQLDSDANTATKFITAQTPLTCSPPKLRTPLPPLSSASLENWETQC